MTSLWTVQAQEPRKCQNPNCGESILENRLQAQPAARFCISCQESLERDEQYRVQQLRYNQKVAATALAVFAKPDRPSTTYLGLRYRKK